MQYPSLEAFSYGSTLRGALEDKSEEARENYLWYVQEKIDGSNLGMHRIDTTIEFTCRHHIIDPTAEMFAKACEQLTKLLPKLDTKFVYHGEAVRKTKHNVAEYVRIPRHYFVCFDIYDIETRRYLAPDELRAECERVGLEHVKFLYENTDLMQSPEVVMKDFISKIENGELESMLGGVPEGVVFKHHHFWQKDKYISAKRKLVTKKFKECQRKRQQKQGFTADAFLQGLGEAFALPARFAKARQHLAENAKPGQNAFTRRQMVRELDVDFDKEYKEEIMIYLWQEIGPVIKEHARSGLDKWMQEQNTSEDPILEKIEK